MAIKPTRQDTYIPPEQAFPGEDRGEFRAFTLVKVQNIFGHEVYRKVSLGMMPFLALDKAKEMTETARKNNPDIQVHAEWKTSL